MKTKITKSKAKKRAWKAFSLYIRKKDMNSMGFVNCYTCDKRVFYKEANAGHAIGGRNNAILFNEDLVRVQCVGCNVWGRGQYAVFTRKLIDELGLKKYDELIEHARDTVQLKVADYLEIESFYRKKLEDLKNA